MPTLDDNFWNWVNEHTGDDTDKLRLKYGRSTNGFDYDAAILQIECRKRFGKKLSQTLAKDPLFYFPNKLSGEQSTSDRLAAFHSELVRCGESMADLTSGLGIDVMHCSRQCSEVKAIELDAATASALIYNAPRLGCDNIDVHCCDCRDFLSSYNGPKIGTVFIDPARRAQDGSRVYALSDCRPDIVAMLDDLSHKCRRLVIKMSPMLDISHTISELGGCNRIIALGNATECKELLAIKDFEVPSTDTEIEAVTLLECGECRFSFTHDDELNANASPTDTPQPGDYLYEPYPSTMKIGAQRLLADRFGLSTFHPNTRLFHSQDINKGFPGEIFKIERVIDYASKNIKRIKSDYPAISVSARNFGISADELRKKLGVRDGGNRRLIALTDSHGKRLMLIVSSKETF